MNKTRIISALLAAALAVPAATARQLTVAEAAAAAGLVSGTMAPAGSARLTLSREGLNTVYIVNAGNGYAVLAADDVAPALLGFADKGAFDPDNMPDNMRAWLDDYSAYISYAARNGCRVVAAPADPSLTDISPILTTKWNQDAPYNDMCPRVNGVETFTGCVATAIAQVLNTYRWPVSGTGTYSYTWNNSQLTFDYANTTFDWDNMADDYTQPTTDEQKHAVAELMYACGICSDMNYGTGGSGTAGVYMAMGLMRNMGYSHDMRYPNRDCYSLPEWSRMLYAELQEGHPVYYDGANNSIGHAFVVDGYRSSDGFFHINWGWGGMSDGYYSIVTLDPDAQGIGGSTAGYFLSQCALLNLRPAEEDAMIYPEFVAKNILPQPVTATRGEYIYLGDAANGGFFNMSLGEVSVQFGIELTAENAEPIYAFYDETFNLEYARGFRQIPVSTTLIPEGMFTGRAVAKCNGMTVPFRIGVSETSEFTVVSTAESVTFSPIEKSISLSCDDIKALTPFFCGRKAYIEATVTNNGTEYYGMITANFTNSAGSTSTFGEAIVDITPGESHTLRLTGEVPASAPVGAAKIQLTDARGNVIGEPMEITVENVPVGTPAPNITNGVFVGPEITGDGTSSNPYVVEPSNINVTADLSVGGGYYSSSVRAYVVDSKDAIITFLQAPLVACWGTETQQLTFSGDLSASIEPGENYRMIFAYLNGNTYNLLLGSTVWFTASRTSGISAVGTDSYGIYPNPVHTTATVTAPAAITAVEAYDLAGALRANFETGSNEGRVAIDAGALAPGNYLLRVSAADSSVRTLRMIKR